MKFLSIGIGGSSCSGKSTLAVLLSQILPNAHILHQDRFYKPDRDIPIEQGVANWDCPEALDMDSFISALQEAKLHGLTTDMLGDNRAQWNEMDLDSATVALYKQQISSLIASLSANGNDIGFIIVDGFLLYSDDRALKLLDLPLFLKADRQVLIERRNRRNGYITIEGFWQEPEGYFDNFVWPMYLKYNFKVLDGSFQTKVLDSNKLSIGECVEHTIALIKGII